MELKRDKLKKYGLYSLAGIGTIIIATFVLGIVSAMVDGETSDPFYETEESLNNTLDVYDEYLEEDASASQTLRRINDTEEQLQQVDRESLDEEETTEYEKFQKSVEFLEVTTLMIQDYEELESSFESAVLYYEVDRIEDASEEMEEIDQTIQRIQDRQTEIEALTDDLPEDNHLEKADTEEALEEISEIGDSLEPTANLLENIMQGTESFEEGNDYLENDSYTESAVAFAQAEEYFSDAEESAKQLEENQETFQFAVEMRCTTEGMAEMSQIFYETMIHLQDEEWAQADNKMTEAEQAQIC